jgi:para-nitrobenzyl esterase
LARGLFRRAIGQSGGLFEPLEVAPEFKLAGAEKEGAAFAERLGARSLDALRALPASEISARPYYPHANVDGYFLTATPYKVLSEGRGSDIDLLIGSNAQEGLDFLGDRRIGADNMSDELKRDFPAFIVSLVGPNAAADDKAARDAFIAFESDMRFGWNMWTWARLSAAAGERTYFYRFTHTPPGEEGATHGAEMRYVFDHLDLQTRAWTANDHRLADTMADYWTNFARTGDPNGEGLPDWPAFDSSDRRALHLGADYRAAHVDNERSIESIDRLYAAVRFLLQYGAYVAGALTLLVLVALWSILSFVLRAWAPRKA